MNCVFAVTTELVWTAVGNDYEHLRLSFAVVFFAFVKENKSAL